MRTVACSEQHFRDHHLKASYRREYEAVLADLLKAPRTLEFLTPVRDYQKAGN
jgi:hypothetical protein